LKDLTFTVVEQNGQRAALSCSLERVLLAGYTGRDRTKVMEHIHELEQLGVAPPGRVPMVFTVPPDLATVEPRIAVASPDTSGEVEFYLAPAAGRWLVGVGSDHTDRKQEAIDVAASKALCSKVLSREVWRYDDLAGHWDQIEIRSWAVDSSGRHRYQEGRLDAFLSVDKLLVELHDAGYDRLDGCLIFGGTLPTIAGLVCGNRFEGELHDPVLGRTLRCGYDVAVAPNAT
jgi:hypothetical protein